MTHEWGRQIDDRSLGGRRTGREGDYPVLCYSAGGWSERGRAGAGGKPRKHMHMHIFPCTCYILYYGGGLGSDFRSEHRIDMYVYTKLDWNSRQ